MVLFEQCDCILDAINEENNDNKKSCNSDRRNECGMNWVNLSGYNQKESKIRRSKAQCLHELRSFGVMMLHISVRNNLVSDLHISCVFLSFVFYFCLNFVCNECNLTSVPYLRAINV
eukprot:280226_1